MSTGKSATFEVNTIFPSHVTFQWQHNNVSIAGDRERYSDANTSILTVVNLMKGDTGNYTCIVTTEFGLDVASQQVQLKVCKYENCHQYISLLSSMMRLSKNIVAVPEITAGPENITINRNEASLVTFTVTVHQTMDEEFTYQWQRNSSHLMELPGKFEGVNTSVLTIKDARKEDEGSYRCVIFNGAGDNVTSNNALLSVGKLSI